MDVRLSEKQDMEAAKAFFAQAHEMAEHPLERVMTDGTPLIQEQLLKW